MFVSCETIKPLAHPIQRLTVLCDPASVGKTILMHWRGNRIKPHSWNYVPSARLRMLTFDTTNPDLTRPQMRRGTRPVPHLTARHYVHVSSAIYVINVAGWLQNSVRLEHFFCLSLAWLPRAVIYIACHGVVWRLMLIDPRSPFLLLKWKDSPRPEMEHVTMWSDKLKSSLLSRGRHRQPVASSVITMISPHRSSLPSVSVSHLNVHNLHNPL